MPVLRTDDAAARLRNVWLGGKGFEFPFAARYTAWGVAAVLFVGFAVATGTLLPTRWFFLLGLPLSLAGAIGITRTAMRHVTPDRTVSSHLRVLRAELVAPRPRDDTHEFVVAISPTVFDRT